MVVLTVQASEAVVRCRASRVAAATFGRIAAIAVVAWDSAQRSAYIAAEKGLFLAGAAGVVLLDGAAHLSVAYSAAAGVAAGGTQDHVQLFNGTRVVSREWVTDLGSAAGGVYDGPARSLVFDEAGILYAANEAWLEYDTQHTQTHTYIHTVLSLDRCA